MFEGVDHKLFYAMGLYTEAAGQRNSRPVYEFHGVVFNFLLHYHADGFWCLTSTDVDGDEDAGGSTATDLAIAKSDAPSPDIIEEPWTSPPAVDGSRTEFGARVRLPTRKEMPASVSGGRACRERQATPSFRL